ncbi:peptidoglycan DD-metalloendopeptidase family protein [Bacillus testis]|uniref:peptidoglycan DD-metalloendopeptidase family protein n=1 Tax=Bacillus testis TaxID=1622072 RepID=UPI00067EDCA1|nr:peptidoglycan DD-metalloendopeptidase family protein [Bacillus testis]
MLDYGKRVLIALIVAAFIGMLFIGGTTGKAAAPSHEGFGEEWIWPARGEISDHFGARGGTHKGIDIAGEYRSPVVAAKDGVVSKSYTSQTYGEVVFITHSNHSYETVYAHLYKRFVKEGQSIKKGQRIGEMGNTGASDGVHLHFEIHKPEWTFDKQNAINPSMAVGGVPSEQEAMPVMNSRSQMKYIVREGDTLSSIGNRYHVPVYRLLQLNKLDSDQIFINQVLILNE